MIKTEFMGWALVSVYRMRWADKGGWRCRYARMLSGSSVQVEGEGHSPEAALADAQKLIKQGSKV